MTDIKFSLPECERMPLPSNGYGPQKLKELLVRPMTMKEEKMLTNKSLVKAGKVQEEIFKSCVVTGITVAGEQVSVNWNQFLSEDEYALLLFLRAISYGRDYEITIQCPECSKKTKIVIDLEKDIDVKLAGPEIENGITIKLPVSGKIVKMHYPTRADMSDDVYSTMVKCIETADSVEKSIIPMWLETLTARDISELRKAVNNPSFGATKNITFVCPNDKCDSGGEELKVGLPITAEFFRIEA